MLNSHIFNPDTRLLCYVLMGIYETHAKQHKNTKMNDKVLFTLVCGFPLISSVSLAFQVET